MADNRTMGWASTQPENLTKFWIKGGLAQRDVLAKLSKSTLDRLAVIDDHGVSLCVKVLVTPFLSPS